MAIMVINKPVELPALICFCLLASSGALWAEGKTNKIIKPKRPPAKIQQAGLKPLLSAITPMAIMEMKKMINPIFYSILEVKKIKFKHLDKIITYEQQFLK